MTRQEFEKEKEKLSKMTFKEKIVYIFSYYSTQIIILCVAAFLLFEAGGILYRYSQEDLLYCLFVDELHVTRQEAERLEADFRGYAGISGKKQVTTFDISLDFTDPDYAEASIIKLTGLQATGTIDVIVTTQNLLDRLQAENLYMDLSQALPEELLTQLSDRLYYAKNHDGQTVPMGISLKDSYLGKIMTLEEDSYLTVASMDNDPETVLNYIRYCFGLKLE